jgi:hypothetical protein
MDGLMDESVDSCLGVGGWPGGFMCRWVVLGGRLDGCLDG